MPVRHEECLGFQKVGMGAGQDLGGAPVELVDGRVGCWEAWKFFRYLITYVQILAIVNRTSRKKGAGLGYLSHSDSFVYIF